MTSPSLSKCLLRVWKYIFIIISFLQLLFTSFCDRNTCIHSIYGISTTCQCRTTDWLSGYHRPQNEQKQISQKLHHCFFPPSHFLLVYPKQWWSQLKLYTSSTGIQRQSHSTQMTRNKPPKDCHGNRAFQKHHHSFTSCNVEPQVC